MAKYIGIVDEPIEAADIDRLDIGAHSNALMRFIQHANTPITVGIQGEWGSGKTSLINTLHKDFEEQKHIKQVWINAWEHSLLSTPEESLLKIISYIIDEIVEVDGNKAKAKKIRENAEQIFKGALRVGAQLSMGAQGGAVAKELLDSGQQSIAKLRKELELVIEAMANDRKANSYEKVVIYVDDLDRIEPKNAVAILELLKNIFSVKRCVFILAIDFQVVVKGLESKFGPQTPENEWEFRAFFDKIIQLPFMMPMGRYNIGKYVNGLLMDIGFIEGQEIDEGALSEIINLTIGGNPRSIKRLINSISLISLFSQEVQQQDAKQSGDSDTEDLDIDTKLLHFALVCLQIAYPSIYSTLVSEPNFPAWDDNFAAEQTGRSEERASDNVNLPMEQRKALFEERFAAAKQTGEFDEAWEKALFRLCYTSPRLRIRATDISKFFNFIRLRFFGDQDSDLEEKIVKALGRTSVTSVISTTQPNIVLPERKGAYFRRRLDGIDAFLHDGKVTQKASEAAINCLKKIHDDLLDGFLEPEAEFRFHGSMSLYKERHKFFAAGFQSSRSLRHGTRIELIRHFKHEYKLPKHGVLSVLPSRTFRKNSYTSAHLSDRYLIEIPNLEVYEQNIGVLKKLFLESAEMAASGWDKRLKINYADGTMTSALKNYENFEDQDEASGFPKLTAVCKSLLSADYTYDL